MAARRSRRNGWREKPRALGQVVQQRHSVGLFFTGMAAFVRNRRDGCGRTGMVLAICNEDCYSQTRFRPDPAVDRLFVAAL
jgi:hypothetical protein